MNPAISQLEAFITRLDRQRAHIELSLMDQTRPAQEQLEQTYDLLFELRQIAATSLHPSNIGVLGSPVYCWSNLPPPTAFALILAAN